MNANLERMRNSGHDMTVSQQWRNRPSDERFTSLDSMAEFLALRNADSNERVIELSNASFSAGDDNEMHFGVGSSSENPKLTHWSFRQMCRSIGAPAGYMNTLPGDIAVSALNHSLWNADSDTRKMMYTQDTVRSVTSETYGRIYDSQVVDIVRGFAGNGNGDTNWRVPGALDWATGVYSPAEKVTKEMTTLYAGDRDIFLFLIDDQHPIEVGKLRNGEPDIMFRGFYVWNSEVGSKTLGLSTMYLRAVCGNRILWGVENFQQIKIVHSKNAPNVFHSRIVPSLNQFTQSSTDRVVNGVIAAKQAVLTGPEFKEQVGFLNSVGFNDKSAASIIRTSQYEEETDPCTAWDYAQAITAFARKTVHQDKRVEMEQIAGSILDKVAA